MNAIVDTADPVTVFRSYPQIAGTLREHLQTDIPAALLPAFVDLGDRIKAGTQTSVAFVPPLITSANPDFALIRQTVAQALIPVPPEVPAARRRARPPTVDPDRASRAGRDHHTDAGSDTGAAGQPRYRLLGPKRATRPRLFGGPMSGREAAPFRGPIGYECGTVPESVRGCTGVCFDGQAHAPVRRRGRATSMMPPPPPGWHRRTTGNHTELRAVRREDAR